MPQISSVYLGQQDLQGFGNLEGLTPKKLNYWSLSGVIKVAGSWGIRLHPEELCPKYYPCIHA